MTGAMSTRSAALQTRRTPGIARAPAVATFLSRAYDSALRTTPRCSAPSRVRSSTKRPPPLRRRWSSFRRGEVPIMLARESTTRARGSPRLDFSHMADVERAFARLTWTMHVSNLIGALLTWFYFRFVDFTAPQFGAKISRAEIIFFVVAFGALISAGVVWGSRWARPLSRPGAASADLQLVRRRAIMVPYVFAAIAFAG